MASRAGSTTAIGTAYEKYCLHYLNNSLHMSLVRCGGARDEGIDLKGGWWLPAAAFRQYKPGPLRVPNHRNLQSPYSKLVQQGVQKEDEELDKTVVNGAKRLRVFAQCKAEKRALGSRLVREMEGVLAHHYGQGAMRGPHLFSSKGAPRPRLPPRALGIVLSQSGFSQLALIRAWKSPSPMMLIHLEGGDRAAPRSGSAVLPSRHPTLEAASAVIDLSKLDGIGAGAGVGAVPGRTGAGPAKEMGEAGSERQPGVQTDEGGLAGEVEMGDGVEGDTRETPETGEAPETREARGARETQTRGTRGTKAMAPHASEQERIPVVGAWWNRHVVGGMGLFKDGLELKRFLYGDDTRAEGYYQIWWKGRPLSRSGPEFDIIPKGE